MLMKFIEFIKEHISETERLRRYALIVGVVRKRFETNKSLRARALDVWHSMGGRSRALNATMQERFKNE